MISFFRAVLCMGVHRNLKMVHGEGGEHLVTCGTCDYKHSKRTVLSKNMILTHWYFRRDSLFSFLSSLVFVPIGVLHRSITKREGKIEHPPEHAAGHAFQERLAKTLPID